MSREVILPFPTPLQEATAFRSTWLASSISSLREIGYFERYLKELPVRYHEPILFSVAGTWLSVDVAAEHYQTLSRLNLDHEDLKRMARAVTERVHGTALGTIVRLAKQSGVTPWHVMTHLNRFWERVWQGGGLRVMKLSEKDATIEIGAWPLAESHYIQIAMPFVAEAILGLFSRKVFVRLLPDRTGRNQLTMHASWV